MPNAIWNQVEAEFERRREENSREESRRRAEIAERCPELNRLVEERHSLIMRSVRGAFAGGGLSDAEAVMLDYNRRIAAMLQKNGYPADYLSPVCKCAVCGDLGFVYEQSVRKPCECFLQEYRQALCQTEGTGGSKETFAAFDENRFPDAPPLPGINISQRQLIKRTRDWCVQFAEGVPGGPIKTLLLHGGSGLGKTFLLHCMENAVREKGIAVISTTAFDLLMKLKTAYFSNTGETAQEFFDVPLLLIDDLGMEPMMENITVEQIYNLLNARMTKGLYTAITTNLTLDEVKKRYTERVSSRLLNKRVAQAAHFQGKDIRMMK